jgi:transposase
MLDEDVRTAVLQLHHAGNSRRGIAKALKISRESVLSVLLAGTAAAPQLVRTTLLDDHQERVVALHRFCRGNLVRVHELLAAEGVKVSYSTVTEFCRLREIGHKPKTPAGEYHFEPGQEMQHDTSPHRVKLGAREVLLQCASLVLCFSRMLFTQVFFRWTRLQARQFLTEALQYFGGAAGQCMVDNSNVVLSHGSGKHAVMAAEMVALGERFGFKFIAHEVGDANRSARVERPFHFIEHNFHSGRTFTDRDDCNAQLLAWCDEKNAMHRKSLHASPRELFVAEMPSLKPMPLHVPEIYESETRIVDLMGYVSLHTNRYSVPAKLIGQQVQVREYKDKVRVCLGARRVTEHPLLAPGADQRSRLAEHRHPREGTLRQQRLQPVIEEVRLRAADPLLARYVDGLRKRHPGRAVAALRRLERLWRDHPQASVLAALTEALNYGMYDLARLERMVLRRIAGDVFGIDPMSDSQLTFDWKEPDDDDD